MKFKLFHGLSQLAIYVPQPLGKRFRRCIWRRLLKRCGRNLSIHMGVIIKNPENIEIGNNVTLAGYVVLAGGGGIKIGNNTVIGHAAKIYSHSYKKIPGVLWNDKQEYSPVEIGSNTWIGANAVITSGVKIGDNVIIGANAVVTKDIPSNSLAVGVPARVKQKGIYSAQHA